MAEPLRHRQTKGAETDMPSLPPPRHIPTLPISAVRRSCRVDCGQLDPGAVIRADPGESQPRMPERLDQEELADCSAGRDAVYQLAALTVGAHLVVADG